LWKSSLSLDRNQGRLVGQERRAFTSFSALLGEASVLSTRRRLDKRDELLVAQCCQGIGAHRAPRRYVTGEEGDEQQQDGDGGERQGSVALTPKSVLDKARVSANDAASPMTIPKNAKIAP